MLKKKGFDQIKSGKRAVELRNIQPQWKNARIGDEAVLMSGKRIMRKRILEIHRGSLARIFVDVNFKRIFPEAKDIIEARKKAREIYPKDEEFMAFEIV